jgi:phosphohistidine phosphatase
MKLYLVQHAKAAPKEVNPQRPLTGEGLRDIRKIAEFIEPLHLCVDYLWHSGKRRAVQTAEVLAKVINVNIALTERQGFGPTDDVAVLRAELASVTGDIMIVGHLPFLDKLASLLVTGFESANTVAFKQGGIVCLSRCDEDKWQIDWMITPELLAD